MTTSAAPFDSRLAPIFTDVKAESEPQTYWHQKAKDVRLERIDGVVHLYRYTDILAVNRHPAVLGQGGRGSILGSNSALIPLEIDGADHMKYRKLLDPLFAPKRVALLESSFRVLAAELIDSFSDEKEVDLYEKFCVPLPCLTFLRLVGAPTEDLDFFLEFKDAVIHAEGDTPEQKMASAAVAGLKLYEYLNALIEERRKHPPRDDLLGALMQGTVDGEPVSQLELLNMLFLLMFAGLDTVTASMSCIFSWLARHPEQRDLLVKNPDSIRAAVEELLRYESPVPAGTRYATEDIDLGGEAHPCRRGHPRNLVRCQRRSHDDREIRSALTSSGRGRFTWCSRAVRTAVWARTSRVSNCVWRSRNSTDDFPGTASRKATSRVMTTSPCGWWSICLSPWATDNGA